MKVSVYVPGASEPMSKVPPEPVVAEPSTLPSSSVMLTATPEGDNAVIDIEKERTPLDQVGGKIKQIVSTTRRKEMVLDIEKEVPWGVETAILDAAKGNGIHSIMSNIKK